MAKDNGRIIMEGVQIQATLDRMAEEIFEQATDPLKLALVGIYTGGVYLARRIESILSGRFKLAVPVGTLDITLYRDDWTRLHTQPLVRASDLPFPIDDSDLVLVDDVLYTGRTVRAALDALIDYGRPRRVQLAILVDRGHRELPICGQFIGIKVDTFSDEQVNVLLIEKDGVDQIVIQRPLTRQT